MLLTVVINWPDDKPINRESMAALLEEVLYEPDVAMLEPMQRGDEGAAEWPFGATVEWKVT